jgi:hypothetical protein
VDPNQPSNQTRPTGPRRSIDGVRRTTGSTVLPVADPAAPQTQAKAPKPPKVSRRQVRKAAKAEKKAAVPTAPRSHGRLKTFFQTVLAIAVILAVATAIVVLYVRYYQ